MLKKKCFFLIKACQQLMNEEYRYFPYLKKSSFSPHLSISLPFEEKSLVIFPYVLEKYNEMVT